MSNYIIAIKLTKIISQRWDDVWPSDNYYSSQFKRDNGILIPKVN